MLQDPVFEDAGPIQYDQPHERAGSEQGLQRHMINTKAHQNLNGGFYF